MLNDSFLYPDDGQFGDLPGQSDQEEGGEEGEGGEEKKEEKDKDYEDAIEEEEE